MELQHINLTDLKPAKVNVRKTGGKDVDDLLPSIRSLGLLQPLLVRPNCEGFEIVAGQRRYNALSKLAEEGTCEPVPCIVMGKGDDAAAIEASLAENIARLPMEEIDQYKAFAALLKAGLDSAEIAARFGVTERLVTQRLTIANLIAPLLSAYRNEEVDAPTLRILTMATKAQQKKWLELLRSDEHYAPSGRSLKAWLFGGASIPVANALFDPVESGLPTSRDLFGEDEYFADSEAFWPLQSKAVAALAERYRADGWESVTVYDIGEHWRSWEHASVDKEDGGEVHITIASDGEVSAHEAVMESGKYKRRQKAAEAGETTTDRPEITKTMQRYLDLHRHAAVRRDLLEHPGMALRLAVAQMIAGSPLWSIDAEAQKAPTEAVAASLAGNKAESAFLQERAEIAALLGIETEATIVPCKDDWGVLRDLHAIFERLVSLEDAQVMRILAFVVSETLAAGTSMIDALGLRLGTDMAASWEPDDVFFDLLRDKECINAMLREIGGKRVADGNATATAKVQKGIIRDYLSGTRKGGKEGWLPRHMAFPMTAYTKRGGIDAIFRWQNVKHYHA